MRNAIFALPVMAAGLAACGDNIEPVTPIDAAVDAAVDAAPDGPCGAGRFVTGELVDIDSTTSTFMGVNAATFTQRGGTAMDATSPNGRFEMCVAPTTTYLFDVDAPADRIDGIAYFEVEAIDSMARTISFRTMTAARAQSFYTERGLTFDPAKAHVMVFVAGDLSNLTLSGGSHDAVQAANDATPGTFTWAAGATGRYVLFPNVDPAGGSVQLIGDLSGNHTVPVEAGKLTWAALFWVFL